MHDDILDPLTKAAIVDRLEGWELIEFLQISIERVVDMFEDDILEAIDDIQDFIHIRSTEEDDREEWS